MPSLHAVLSFILLWRASVLAQRSNNLEKPEEVSPFHSVGRFHVLLPHKVNTTTTVPVNFTLTYPAHEAAQSSLVARSKRPLVLLLNGASVESFWYQRVIEKLAKKGFVIAASDYYRPFPYKTPVLPRPGCRQDAIVDASARLINTLYDFIHNVTQDINAEKLRLAFLRRANLDQLLLLGHSLGGFVACDILSGGCEEDSLVNDSCEGYTPVLNAEGKDVVIGAVTFEGYLAGSKMKPRNMTLTERTFTLFLAGEYNKNAREAFIAARDSGSCVSYVAFNTMNHYGMNDFVSPHQVTPCAAPIPTDDPHFTTDAATQAAGVDLIADIIDSTVSIRERGFGRDIDKVKRLVGEPRVWEAMLSTRCLSNQGHVGGTVGGIDME